MSNVDSVNIVNDPAFYLHHAMVDRVSRPSAPRGRVACLEVTVADGGCSLASQIYWIWQALHPEIANAVEGTLTYRNRMPYASRDGTVDDLLDMGVLGKHRPIKDVLDTLGNTPLCYIYA